MQHVVIIGNSGAARECYWIFQDMLRAQPELHAHYTFRGFMSWKQYQGDLKSLSTFFLGDASQFMPAADEVYIIGIAFPALRKEIFGHYKSLHAQFFTLIHPTADVNATATIGEANIFQRDSTVYCDATVGDANYFNGAINVAHDSIVGDYNFFGPYSLVLGQCSVGSCNMIGVRSVLLPKSKIGNNNIISPGSYVYKGFRDNCRVAGNPALKIDAVSVDIG